jgi:hypothetical protein
MIEANHAVNFAFFDSYHEIRHSRQRVRQHECALLARFLSEGLHTVAGQSIVIDCGAVLYFEVL